MSTFSALSQPQQLDRLCQLMDGPGSLDEVERCLADLDESTRPWRVAEFAIRLKDAQRYGDAVALLQRCFDPSNEHHHYQLGLCLSYAQRQHDAQEPLQKAFEMSGGGNPLVAQDHLINLAQLGHLAEARDALTHLKTVDVVPREELERLGALIELLALHPPQQILDRLEAAFSGREWWGVDQVLAHLRVSLRHQEGFAFFRLDDGEGSNLPWDSSAMQASSALLNHNRDIFLGHWFGEDGIAPALSSGWSGIQSELADAAQHVDLIGLNAPKRFRHELAVNSSRGIPSILNTYLWTLLAETQNSLPPLICRAQMHFELGLASDRFFDVIRMAKSVHVISSREAFADLIQRVLPTTDVEFMPIPGERLRVSESGDTTIEAEASSHYPIRYQAILEGIDASAKPGSLWLIGAGLLAKIYCMRVRQNGGVALDLGSLVDLYAGVNSRGFPPQLVQRVAAKVAEVKAG